VGATHLGSQQQKLKASEAHNDCTLD